MAMRISLKSRGVQAQPWVIWNSFLEVISRSPKELEDLQIPAHLVFVYESEVQNGGHLQYLENQGTDGVALTVKALGIFSASCHAETLQGAAACYSAKERTHPETAADYADLALEGEFDEFDARFHACEPSLQEYLEKHLEEN